MILVAVIGIIAAFGTIGYVIAGRGIRRIRSRSLFVQVTRPIPRRAVIQTNPMQNMDAP